MNDTDTESTQTQGEDKLVPLADVARLFPGRPNQWVVRNIIERGKVDCLKVNRAWYIYESSLKRYLAGVTRKAQE